MLYSSGKYRGLCTTRSHAADVTNEGHLQTTIHEVSKGHLVLSALQSLKIADSVSSGIVMQIHPMIQCDTVVT